MIASRQSSGFQFPGRGYMARILVADDDPQVLRLLIRVLQRNQHEVLHTHDGTTALATFVEADGAFDVVVTDFDMPGMNGGELVRALRHNHSYAGGVVIMSGEARNHNALTQLVEEGLVEEFLAKPATPSDISDAVRRALTMSAVRRQQKAGGN